MAKKNSSLGNRHQNSHCPKCKIFIEETVLNEQSVICPFCGEKL